MLCAAGAQAQCAGRRALPVGAVRAAGPLGMEAAGGGARAAGRRRRRTGLLSRGVMGLGWTVGRQGAGGAAGLRGGGGGM